MRSIFAAPIYPNPQYLRTTVMVKLECTLHILLYIINKSFFTLLPIRIDKHKPINGKYYTYYTYTKLPSI